MVFEANTGLIEYLPNFAFILIILIGTILIEFFIRKAYKKYRVAYGPSRHVERTEFTLRVVVLVIGIILILANIPGITQNAVRLTAAGIGLILALSSTTLIANGMSGTIIKFSGFYNVGDMVKIGGYFGKVSEVGVFHTELQTPKRELVTVPNSVVFKEPFVNYTEEKYIVNIPVTISYNIDRKVVSDLLLNALKDTELETPFVLVTELGAYWIKYEANGLLKDPSNLIITESQLRQNILDRFNTANVEILSPDYYAIEKVRRGEKIIPKKRKKPQGERKEEKQAVEKAAGIMFEKAREEEKIAKEKELSKEEIVEMFKTTGVYTKEDIVKWAREKGAKIPMRQTYEEIVELLIKSENISLTDIKQLFEQAEKEKKVKEE